MQAICASSPILRDCFASSWQNGRTEIKGKTVGHVIHIPSNDQYGHKKESDTDSEIRGKMLGLFFLSILSYPARIATRTYLLLSGHNWLWSEAYPQALRAARKDRFFSHFELKKPEKACSNRSIYRQTASRAILHFTEEAVKLATLPIAAILSTGCIFASIVHPLAARRWFAQIEENWSIPLQTSSELFMRTVNFTAICMQPKRVWKSKNFYLFSGSTYGLQLKGKRLLQEAVAYWPEESMHIYETVKAQMDIKLAHSTKTQEKISQLNQSIESLIQRVADALDSGLRPEPLQLDDLVTEMNRILSS